tara:strand:- start:1 stop:159 length:159 start_codon:yes stop_codon:yes gene_type:complete
VQQASGKSSSRMYTAPNMRQSIKSNQQALSNVSNHSQNMDENDELDEQLRKV